MEGDDIAVGDLIGFALHADNALFLCKAADNVKTAAFAAYVYRIEVSARFERLCNGIAAAYYLGAALLGEILVFHISLSDVRRPSPFVLSTENTVTLHYNIYAVRLQDIRCEKSPA